MSSFLLKSEYIQDSNILYFIQCGNLSTHFDTLILYVDTILCSKTLVHHIKVLQNES